MSNLTLQCETGRHGQELVDAVKHRLAATGDKVAHLRRGHCSQGSKDPKDHLSTNFWLQGHFAAILTDVQMPMLDGFQATEAVRKMEDSRHLAHAPIVALTGNVMSQE